MSKHQVKSADWFKARIRTVPDFPEPGIQFRDLTTLLQDADGFRAVVDGLETWFADKKISKVAGIDARGFVLAGALADRLGVGFVAVRKIGKLPFDTLQRDYDLEYGTGTLELHTDSVSEGERVALVDDLIATGGTAAAAAHLLQLAGAELAGVAFIADLPDLGGAEKLRKAGLKVHSLCAFEGA